MNQIEVRKIVDVDESTLNTMVNWMYEWCGREEKYRNRGICKVMMNTVKENAKLLELKELYIFTKHIGLYEKYDWIFIENIDTFSKNPRLQRLYKLEIKD